MQITELNPTAPAQTEALFRLQQAAHAADQPDLPQPLWDSFLSEVRHTSPELRVERLVATAYGELVAGGVVAFPERDNQHVAQLNLQVSPDHRRRGVGRALYGRLRERAGDRGRRVLLASAAGPVPGGPPRDDAGARFLAAMGFSPALETLHRRIDLPAVDAVAEQRLLDECLRHAADYEAVGWTGLTPDPLAGGVAQLTNRLLTDAPRGGLDLTASTLDAGRLQADDRSRLDQHTRLVGVAARHRTTGTVAAVTRINIPSTGDHGWVWLTIADPAHRGHRLGTMIKIEVHRLVRESFPDLRYVYTGNADANAHMVAINDQLGFVPYESSTVYQRTL